MRNYETTIVVDSFVKSEDLQALVKKIRNFITNNGGEILSLEDWGKKRLAYEIRRKQYGKYIHILFKSTSSLPKLLEREYGLEDAILRHLTVLTDPKALLSEEKEQKTQEASQARVDSSPAESQADEAAPQEKLDEVVDSADKIVEP
ncbi:MAG: 30S ribosomal protein S6 [bacterium]